MPKIKGARTCSGHLYSNVSDNTKKHRPRGNRNVRKNSVLNAPSGARTLDTLIKSQTYVRKKNARTPRRMGVWGSPAE